MLATLAAIAALAYSGAPAPIFGATEARDALLATSAPYPSNRPGSAHRTELGRVWAQRSPIGTRTPIDESVYAQPGAASYGAPRAEIDRPIYARAGHNIVAIDPWTRIEGRGALSTLEAARNQWLREQGYIERVRTHVNPARFDHSRADALPLPRATIQLHDEPGPRRGRQRVDATPPGGEITRISLPPQFVASGPARVVERASAVASTTSAD